MKLILVLICGFTTVAAGSETNIWLTSQSARWDQPEAWSLGVLPGANHSAFITNAGWKAVEVNQWTPPSALTVSNLTVAAPDDSWSTLLLNWFNAQPLRVQDRFSLGPNARLSNIRGFLSAASFGSSGAPELVCDNADTQIGAMQFDGSAHFLNSRTAISQLRLAVYTNTTVVQDGGSMRVTNSLWIGGSSYGGSTGGFGADYFLTNGTLDVGAIYVGERSSSRMVAHQGQITSQVYVGGFGSYTSSWLQVGGSLVGRVSVSSLNDRAEFIQLGGTNYLSSVSVEGGYMAHGGMAGYSITDGALFTSAIRVDGGFADCGYGQANSTVVVSGPIMIFGGGCPVSSYCYNAYMGVTGGSLLAQSIEVNPRGHYSQSDAHVNVAGDVSIEGYYRYFDRASYSRISGGSLTCSNLTLGDLDVYMDWATVRVQGTLRHTSELEYMRSVPWGLAAFSFSGDLLASKVRLTSHLVLQPDTNGLPVRFEGPIELGGWISVGDLDIQLGSLTLLPFSDYRPIGLLFSWTNGVMRFRPSATNHWERLQVRNWAGSLLGGRGTQLYFGTNSTGLTESQLRLLAFIDPEGLPPGTYVGKILPTGEVVPDVRPVLQVARQTNCLVLSYPTNCVLQASSFPAGPFVDVYGASSPFTNFFVEPAFYFRLRR